MPSDLLCGEDVIWVDLATVSIDLLTVDPRRTDAGLEVQTYAREIYEFGRAPRAFDVFPGMDRRFEMLIQVVQILELPLAPVAVIGRMFIGNVFLETTFGRENQSAIVTPVPMFGLKVPGREITLVKMSWHFLRSISAITPIVDQAHL